MISRRKSSDTNVALGQIQPDLYRKRGSVISVGSNGGTATVLGRLQLQLTYDHSRSDLLVRLIQATLNTPLPVQLANRQTCRIRISIQGQSLVKARDSEPFSFGEDGQWTAVATDSNTGGGDQMHQPFKLPLSYSELVDAVLLVELLAAKGISYTTGSGQDSPVRYAVCLVPLGSLGPSADDLTVWADLERTSEPRVRGELLICLQYLPAAGRLTLSVHQAANLRLTSTGRTSLPTDLFIRAQLIGPDEKVLKRRKTGTRKVAPDESVIVWDEVLSFEKVDPQTLARCRLEVHMLGTDRFGRGERLLGQLCFGGNNKLMGSSSSSHPASYPSASSLLSSSATTRLWPPDVFGRWTVPRWMPLESVELIPPTTTTAMSLVDGGSGVGLAHQQQQQRAPEQLLA